MKPRIRKDRAPRTIPICEDLYSILRGIPQAIHDNHVFLFRGKPVKNIRKSLANACKKPKIPYGRFVKDGFVFHDLRHSFNTHMRKAGIPESIIKDVTGHSTREIFNKYNTIDMDDRKQAINLFQAFLRNPSPSVDQTVDQTPF